jgi:hypothetical protein
VPIPTPEEFTVNISARFALVLTFSSSTSRLPIITSLASIALIVAIPVILTLPCTSSSTCGLSVPIPTNPDIIVVPFETSKEPTIKLFSKNPSNALKVPEILTFPSTSNFSVGRVEPIPTLFVIGS